jgi:drug/metabolite transporter (DMT)-like permease
MIAVLLVLLAAAVSGLGLVLLRKATQAEPERPTFSWELLWLLIRHRPLWTAGILTMLAEFGLHALALSFSTVSTVQLLVVMELPFTLILSQLILGGRLRVREWSAIATMSLGVVVLLLTLSPHGGHAEAVSGWHWILGLAVTVAAIGAILLASRWAPPVARTALAGVAAGMGAGLIAVMAKPVTAVVGHGVGALVTTWQTWALVVVSLTAFLLLQNALQAGRLVASQPGITLANPLVAVIWGVVVFHEHVRTGWWLLGAGLGAALLVAGAALLSRSPLLAGHQEASQGEEPRTPDSARSASLR